MLLTPFPVHVVKQVTAQVALLNKHGTEGFKLCFRYGEHYKA
jgi:hypothetical protein